MTRSYTYNGKLDTDYMAWERWIEDALSICDGLGFEANYYGVEVADKLGGKAHPISGLSKKVANAKKNNDIITGISIMVLPENFSSVAFDYIITLSRNANYITLIINEDYEMRVDEPVIIDALRNNIVACSGEVYEMDIYECPEVYARKVNRKESFKSLKIIASLMQKGEVYDL